MDNFRFIDAILILTGGGPADATNILPVYLFDVSFQYFKLGRGAAIALTPARRDHRPGHAAGAGVPEPRRPAGRPHGGLSAMASRDIVQLPLALAHVWAPC